MIQKFNPCVKQLTKAKILLNYKTTNFLSSAFYLNQVKSAFALKSKNVGNFFSPPEAERRTL